ncbi:TlpA family protein disulfide reductase [Spongiibacter nanhainus]|uniref:TlpA family protein disulfide reductase n=1 Tax=Spongiibacter nanhainus TaxID=2794344 RepID=A0A7T4R027_9GAMM|nr:TlpA disulfide reductase family protein [Spongiibacter nanhainus]QQD17847.1 TlpA family protein disulfide reductase [Spongiibacter nanhainus]
MWQSSANSSLTVLCRRVLLCLALLMPNSESLAADWQQQAGKPVPEFSLPDLAGNKRHALSDYRGQVVYLDFWASWCGPCRLSLPALNELYRELGPKGFTVLAVNVDAYEEEATDFLDAFPVAYPVLRDAERALPKRFGVRGMPTAFLIDQQGQLVGVHEGFRKGDADKLRRKVVHLLEVGRES